MVLSPSISEFPSVTQSSNAFQLSGKVHFAALSALRNLSLPGNDVLLHTLTHRLLHLSRILSISPATHKQLFLQEGVVDAALHALRHSSMAHVWFKALGTLRLLTDKQGGGGGGGGGGRQPLCGKAKPLHTHTHAHTHTHTHTVDVCSHIVSEEGTISRVCEVCEACASVGPIHLRIEGGRLLAAIVKHCSNAGWPKKKMNNFLPYMFMYNYLNCMLCWKALN